MTQLHSHDLARPDVTIRYWTGGAAADAPTVVFLHGATLDHRAWHPQTDALRPRFHVIAPDLRGHGSSTGRFDFTAAVEDIIALLDHPPGPPVVLVGLSLGANIAQEIIRRRPDLVGGLVAADTIVGYDAQEACTTVWRTSAELFPKVGEGGSVDPDRVLRHNLHGAVVENDRLRR